MVGFGSAGAMKTAPFRNHLGFWAFALLAVAGAASCGGDDAHAEEGKPSGAVCSSGSTLTYTTFGKGFMTMYCERCHSSALTGDKRNGAPADHNFDTFAGIFVMADHIDEHAAAGPDAVNTAMPPSDPKPTEEERRKLGEWLACETKGVGDGGSTGDSGGGGGDGARGDSGGTQTDASRDGGRG